MATAQLMRRTKTSNSTTIKQQVTQFLLTFRNATTSYTESLKFVKQLVAMSISHISHMYKIFSEEDFEDHSLVGVPIKVLHPQKRDQETKAIQLILWIKGAYDALEKKYLKSLILGVSTPENREGEVKESFTFNFTYTENGVTMITGDDGKEIVDPTRTLEGIVQSTVKLFCTSPLAVTSLQNGDKLGNLHFYMKLHYNEGTPEDYEPPNFQPSPKKQFEFASRPTVLQLGTITSPYHGLNLLMHVPKNNRLTLATKKPTTPHITLLKNVKSAPFVNQALKNLSTSPAKKPRKSFTPPTYDELRESALSGLQASRLNLKRGKSPASKSSHDQIPALKKWKASDPVKKVIKKKN